MSLIDIENNYPFLSIVTYGGNEYIGIIINQDRWVTSMYVYSSVRTAEEKKEFIELGEEWWYQSNRMIPINIFLRGEIDKFDYAIVTMNSRDTKVIQGPTVNLNSLFIKRVKRKNVQLVRKPGR